MAVLEGSLCMWVAAWAAAALYLALMRVVKRGVEDIVVVVGSGLGSGWGGEVWMDTLLRICWGVRDADGSSICILRSGARCEGSLGKVLLLRCSRPIMLGE